MRLVYNGYAAWWVQYQGGGERESGESSEIVDSRVL